MPYVLQLLKYCTKIEKRLYIIALTLSTDTRKFGLRVTHMAFVSGFSYLPPHLLCFQMSEYFEFYLQIYV
jgi:hypothetical protein